MSNYSELLKNVKKYIQKNEYKIALNNLEKLLMLLKADYDAGINKTKSGLAFNKLLPVRKELINNNLTEITYNALGIKNEEKETIDYSKPSEFFSDIEEENIKDNKDEYPF